MQIDIITKDDYIPVSKLISKTLKTSDTGYSLAQVKNWMNVYSPYDIESLAKKWNFLVVKENGEIIAVGAHYNDEIHCVFVDPDRQNQGVGKAVMSCLEEKISKKHKKIRIPAASINALDFYNNLNYKITDTHYNEFGMKMFVMSKNIKQSN